MPKVQYLGPYDKREINRQDLSEDPSAPPPEGEEAEILVWEKGGDSVEVTADEYKRLVGLTGGSTWAVEEIEGEAPATDAGADAIDESSSELGDAAGVSGTIEAAEKGA